MRHLRPMPGAGPAFWQAEQAGIFLGTSGTRPQRTRPNRHGGRVFWISRQMRTCSSFFLSSGKIPTLIGGLAEGAFDDEGLGAGVFIDLLEPTCSATR